MVGREGKAKLHERTLFLLLASLKSGGQWDWVARLFDNKGISFDWFLNRFFTCFRFYVWRRAYSCWGTIINANFEWESNTFNIFNYTRYATDVTFQKSFRPIGSVQEGKRYFNGKHKLYGHKVEVSMFPNGLDLGFSLHYPGSVSEFGIKDISRKYRVSFPGSKRCRQEQESQGKGELAVEHPYIWAVLMDKGYQGSGYICRALVPKKKPSNVNSSRAYEARNLKVSSDRIMVENFFGRTGGFWNIIVWGQISQVLTNLHICFHPLRVEDISRFQFTRNHIYDIDSCQILKRQRIQERYRQWHKPRMDVQFRAIEACRRQPCDDN